MSWQTFLKGRESFSTLNYRKYFLYTYSWNYSYSIQYMLFYRLSALLSQANKFELVISMIHITYALQKCHNGMPLNRITKTCSFTYVNKMYTVLILFFASRWNNSSHLVMRSFRELACEIFDFVYRPDINLK